MSRLSISNSSQAPRRRDDLGGEDVLVGGLVGGALEVDAGRADQLGDDDTLGAVDDEGALVGHQREVAHEDRLALDLAGLVVHELGGDEERRGVGEVLLLALLDGVLRGLEAGGLGTRGTWSRRSPRSGRSPRRSPRGRTSWGRRRRSASRAARPGPARRRCRAASRSCRSGGRGGWGPRGARGSSRTRCGGVRCCWCRSGWCRGGLAGGARGGQEGSFRGLPDSLRARMPDRPGQMPWVRSDGSAKRQHTPRARRPQVAPAALAGAGPGTQSSVQTSRREQVDRHSACRQGPRPGQSAERVLTAAPAGVPAASDRRSRAERARAGIRCGQIGRT